MLAAAGCIAQGKEKIEKMTISWNDIVFTHTALFFATN
jgi:hypothetical protein